MSGRCYYLMMRLLSYSPYRTYLFDSARIRSMVFSAILLLASRLLGSLSHRMSGHRSNPHKKLVPGKVWNEDDRR